MQHARVFVDNKWFGNGCDLIVIVEVISEIVFSYLFHVRKYCLTCTHQIERMKSYMIQETKVEMRDITI